ncbi:MAG TPA: hypothetical protein VIG25_01145, partial [Pyrinomonadaceae bacterium]
GTRGRGDAGMRGRGDAGTRRRGDRGTRGRGDRGTRREGDAELIQLPDSNGNRNRQSTIGNLQCF